MVAFNNVTG